MGDVEEVSHINFSLIMELSACDDIFGFKSLIEQEGLENIDRSGLWYGRKLGSNKMGFEERTPLMVAALLGSKEIVNYIINTGLVDVNRSCGSDGVTALHCAVAGLSLNSPEVVTLLINASADRDSRDASGNKPIDMIFPCLNPVFNSRKKVLERLLKGSNDLNEEEEESEVLVSILNPISPPRTSERKEYPVDPTLPDIKNGVYGTDEFRMYAFKIKPCSRAYSHDWTECPFVHPGENARRRDPRKYHYSCVPCPEFRKGSCSRGDSCEYAHGIFECWLHPAQYRTRLCKDETNCSRRVCFFAHRPEELRPLYPSTGSGVPSPRSSFSSCTSSSAFDIGPISPLGLGSATTPPLSPNGLPSPMNGKTWMNWPSATPPTLQLPRSRLKSSLNAREIDFCDEIQSLASPLFSPDIHRKSLNKLGPVSPNISLASSPVGLGSPFSIDSSTGLNSRTSQRSQNFLERSSGMTSPCLNDWGSLDGKLDWSVHGDELQKLRKSASVLLRAGGLRDEMEEPDVSWVEPMVKEPTDARLGPVWMEQSFMETEQTVA